MEFKSEAILREESGDEAQSLKDRFAFKDVRAQSFPHTDFFKTLTDGRK